MSEEHHVPVPFSAYRFFLFLFGLSLTGRSAEYTEVPLGALDIAAADSLTLSPHPGRCKMDVSL